MTNADVDELERIVAHLHLAHEVAGLGSWEGFGPGSPLYWSPQSYAIMGWSPDRRPSFERFVESVHPDDRDPFLEMRDDALAGRAPYRMQVRIVRPDGEIRHLDLAAHVERDSEGSPTRFIGSVLDRTDAVAEADAAEQAVVARRRLLHDLLGVADRERTQLGADLGARLFGRLARVRRSLDAHLDGVDGSEGTAHGAALQRAVAAIDQAMQSSRSLVSSLEPFDLDEQELRKFISQLGPAGGIATTVAVDESISRADDDQRRAAGRIVREALVNAYRHSQARRVGVRVWTTRDDLLLEVVDDGQGFDVEAHRPAPGHLGLRSMRERALAAGGTCSVASRPGCTMVAARIPNHAGSVTNHARRRPSPSGPP